MSQTESSTKLVKKEMGKLFETGNVGVYEAILKEWRLYEEGQLSKHDFFCEVASFLPTTHQDLLLQLRMLVGEANTGSPTST